MLRVTAWPSVILSGAKNLSGDVSKMARAYPGQSERRVATSWRQYRLGQPMQLLHRRQQGLDVRPLDRESEAQRVGREGIAQQHVEAGA